MGLDKPVAEQYPHFIAGLSRGDLALSFLTTRPVNDDIAETFSATLKLVLATIVIAFAVGVPMGVVAAANKDGTTDSLIRFFCDVHLFKYMLRPAFVPPMTILGLEFASLLGNAFVVELVFAWPGIASYGVRSIPQAASCNRTSTSSWGL
jgi:ABC-type dipeptide/oligopeptide/nickel transport system permease component